MKAQIFKNKQGTVGPGGLHLLSAFKRLIGCRDTGDWQPHPRREKIIQYWGSRLHRDIIYRIVTISEHSPRVRQRRQSARRVSFASKENRRKGVRLKRIGD